MTEIAAKLTFVHFLNFFFTEKNVHSVQTPQKISDGTGADNDNEDDFITRGWKRAPRAITSSPEEAGDENNDGRINGYVV